MALCSYSQPNTPIEIQSASSGQRSIHIIRSDDTTALIRVFDGNSRPLRGIHSNDITVVRDGDTAVITECVAMDKITTEDITISFVFDNSSSMFGIDDSLPKRLVWLLDSLAPGCLYNIVSFDDSDRGDLWRSTARKDIYVAQTGFTGNKDSLLLFCQRYLSKRIGFSPLSDAIAEALDRIHRRRHSDNSRQRSDLLFIITDGDDNASTIGIHQLLELTTSLLIQPMFLVVGAEMKGKFHWYLRNAKGRKKSIRQEDDLRKFFSHITQTYNPVYRLMYYFPMRGAIIR